MKKPVFIKRDRTRVKQALSAVERLEEERAYRALNKKSKHL